MDISSPEPLYSEVLALDSIVLSPKVDQEKVTKGLVLELVVVVKLNQGIMLSSMLQIIYSRKCIIPIVKLAYKSSVYQVETS